MASRSRKAATAAAAAAAAKKKQQPGGRNAHDDQFMAAAIGDVEWLRQSLKESGAPGSFDRNGLAAIHLAAIHGRLDCLRLLIEHHRCDVNSASGSGWRPVHLCISAQTGPRSLQCLLYLLDKGADHSCVNEDMVTPVHQAASEGHLQALQLLIKLGAKLDQTDVRGFRPIDMAKIWGHQKCARLLAAETWHREKDQVAKKLHMEKRVAMRELLRQFEKEEQIPGDLRYLGREDFNEWVQQVDETKSGGHLRRHMSKEEAPAQPQQLQQPQKPVAASSTGPGASVGASPAERYRQPMEATAPVRGDTNASLQARVREVIEEASEILGESGATTPNQLASPRKQTLPQPPTLRIVQHDQEWNHSTKVATCFHPYQKALEDVYPRDTFTKMPHPKNSFPLRLNALSSHPEAALAGEADRWAMKTVGQERLGEWDTEEVEADDVGTSGDAHRRPLSSLAQQHLAQPDGSSRQLREQLFACKSVLDIQRRKRFEEVVRKYRGEAAAHLTSDATSFLFRDALGLEPLEPGRASDPAAASTPASGSRKSSGSLHSVRAPPKLLSASGLKA